MDIGMVEGGVVAAWCVCDECAVVVGERLKVKGGGVGARKC